MSSDANKRRIRCFINEVINTGTFATLSAFVAEQIIDYNADPEHSPGIEGYKLHLQGVHSTFPDFQLTIEGQIAFGDLVVTQVTGRGTHQGGWLDIKPQGTPVVVTGINIDRLAKRAFGNSFKAS